MRSRRNTGLAVDSALPLVHHCGFQAELILTAAGCLAQLPNTMGVCTLE